MNNGNRAVKPTVAYTPLVGNTLLATNAGFDLPVPPMMLGVLSCLGEGITFTSAPAGGDLEFTPSGPTPIAVVTIRAASGLTGKFATTVRAEESTYGLSGERSGVSFIVGEDDLAVSFLIGLTKFPNRDEYGVFEGGDIDIVTVLGGAVSALQCNVTTGEDVASAVMRHLPKLERGSGHLAPDLGQVISPPDDLYLVRCGSSSSVIRRGRPPLGSTRVHATPEHPDGMAARAHVMRRSFTFRGATRTQGATAPTVFTSTELGLQAFVLSVGGLGSPAVIDTVLTATWEYTTHENVRTQLLSTRTETYYVRGWSAADELIILPPARTTVEGFGAFSARVSEISIDDWPTGVGDFMVRSATIEEVILATPEA